MHDVSMQVFPTCKVKHGEFKSGLRSFQKLHPHLLGGDPEDPDTVMNHISYGVRIMLAMYRKCRRSISAWETAQRTFKGKPEILQTMASVLASMQPVKKKDDPPDADIPEQALVDQEAQRPIMEENEVDEDDEKVDEAAVDWSQVAAPAASAAIFDVPPSDSFMGN